VVSMVITNYGVIEVTGDGLVLREVARGLTAEDVVQATGAQLIVDLDPDRVSPDGWGAAEEKDPVEAEVLV
jgi:acyl CoA:acetate/3-ketoacid CoA transferase beta subunit